MEKYSDIPEQELSPQRIPGAEQRILKHQDDSGAVHYARDVIKGRWPEAEPFIKQNPLEAYQYAEEVIKGRWPEAEHIIVTHPFSAYMYATQVLKDRWTEAEPIIKEDLLYWHDYLIFLKEIGRGMDTWGVENW